ncbi:MAG TPA: hypothetical protein VIC87_07250, partial [Vicinamibacteria bacterium]
MAAPSLAPLWGRRVVLSRLGIQGARVRIRAFAQGGDDLPRLRGGRGAGLEVRIERLTVERSELLLEHARVPLDLDLPRFRGRLSARRTGGLEGTLAFGPGAARFGGGPALPVATTMDVILDGRALTVTSAHLTAKGTDLAYNGRLRFETPPQGAFALSGRVDLDTLDRHVLRTDFGLGGVGVFDGRLGITGSRFRLDGTMEGGEGACKGVPVPRFAGRVRWSEAGLELRGLDVETLGGHATLDIDVPRGRGVAR